MITLRIRYAFVRYNTNEIAFARLYMTRDAVALFFYKRSIQSIPGIRDAYAKNST